MPLQITTTSCISRADWEADRSNAIYPAFVDNLPYWTFKGDGQFATSMADHFQLKATGGANYTWEPAGGALPPGLSMDINGRIKGTPTQEGEYEFRVSVSSPGEASVEKTLKMIAEPWRAKWLRDARTTITTHWGKMSYPPIKNTMVNGVVDTFIDEWVCRVTDYDAVAYANKLEDWGIDVLEVSPVWQNRALTWPSTTYTRYHDHSTRDFLGEIINECHSKGKKVLGYFAPDSEYYAIQGQTGYQRYILTDADDNGNWATPNIGAIRELVRDKKLDGFVFDIGAARELPTANPGWLNREDMISSMRYYNPWCIFGINPGTRDFGQQRGGTLLAYPHCDFVIFESVKSESKSTSEAMLALGIPSAATKKMAIYAWQQISTSWAYGEDSGSDPLKNIIGIRNNMSKNWNVGATMSCGLPVIGSGVFVDSHFQETFDEIGAYHSAHKNFSEDPLISYADGLITITTTNKARIFYTLDGTEPNTGSSIYMHPIPVATNTRIRARTLQNGKKIGYIQDFYAESLPAAESMTLFENIMDDLITSQTNGNYRGMLVKIGRTPLELTGIGRKVAGAITQKHPLIIRRRWDEYPMYVGAIKEGDPIEGSYRFSNIGAIRLEAGQSYIIACREGAGPDQFASNAFGKIPDMPYLEIMRSFMLSEFGDLFPIVEDDKGQYLNLKYRPLAEERSANILLGSTNKFLKNDSDAELGASATVFFPNNATNGDDVSYAVAGGEVAYRLQCDAGVPYEVSRVKILFGEGFPTDFEILCGMTPQIAAMKSIIRIANSEERRNFDIHFSPRTARYWYLKAIKPDVAGQTGAQMNVIKFEAFR